MNSINANNHVESFFCFIVSLLIFFSKTVDAVKGYTQRKGTLNSHYHAEIYAFKLKKASFFLGMARISFTRDNKRIFLLF